MPFLIPVGMGIAGAFGAKKLLGGGGGGEATPAKVSPEDTLTDLMKQQGEYGKEAWGKGKSLIDLALGKLGQVGSYLSPLVGGSRTSMMEAMSPELQGLTERNNAAFQGFQSLMPRSGGINFDPMRTAGDVTNTLLGARPKAASSMLDLGSTYGKMGGDLESMAANFLGGAGRNASSLLDYSSEKWKQKSQLGQGIANLALELIKMIKGGKGDD